MEINERIKLRRKELDLSVEYVAEKLGISRASYYRYEKKDVHNLPITAIDDLAKVLNVSPAWIMGWEYTTPLSYQEQTLVNDFRKLSPSGQHDALRYVRMLKADEQEQIQKEDKSYG